MDFSLISQTLFLAFLFFIASQLTPIEPDPHVSKDDWEYIPRSDKCIAAMAKASRYIMMDKPEEQLFREGISRASRYFEIGSGGSTVNAALTGMKVISVEGDRDWVNDMKKRYSPLCDVDLQLVDFHTSYNLSYPSPNTTHETILQYTRSYKPEYKADMILIDGRFRVACALNVLKYIDETTEVYIHDFERKDYHIVLNYYTKEKQAGRLVKLRKKMCAPQEVIDKYEKIPL